jgi:Nif-specific regulatory protein
MNPRLVAIAGPMNGTVFPLPEREISIGREPYNQLCIRDPAVSRRHCTIKSVSGMIKIVDQESLNGTYVNNLPVKDRILQHGDQLRIGASLFLILTDEKDTGPRDTVRLDEDTVATSSTVLLRREDALYLQPEKLQATPLPRDRMARDLNALVKFSTSINSLRDMFEIEKQVLQQVLEIVPAERGAILLAEPGSEEFSSFGWDRVSGTKQTVTASRTVVQRVMTEGVAIVSNDVLCVDTFKEAESLISSGTGALLAVPLAVYDKIIGVIYLSTNSATVQFDEDHLQLMTAIAAISAIALENARHVEWLESENQRLQTDINIEHSMVGESPQMREIYQTIGRIAPTDSTVLICGESGTGKELAARAIHLNSTRASKPFVAINCAALTETLLESELFGHEKGAFTGAIAQKKGKLEVADGGTLFLDEIGELAPTLQAKLLRVLQEREFERVGGTRSIKVNIRLIAATNKDLEEAAKHGGFRQDLYYRLNVVSLTMPALRKRRGDIPVLASYFAAKSSEKCRRRIIGISPDARARLLNYDWPGNVRELENAIERAVVLGAADVIMPEDLPESLLEADPPAGATGQKYYEAVKEAKKQIVLNAFHQANGNYPETAKLLGVHPNNLYRLIRNLNMKLEL